MGNRRGWRMVAVALALAAGGCSWLDAAPPDPATTSTTAAPVDTVPPAPPSIPVPLVVDGVRRPGGPWSPGDGALVMEPLNGSALLAFDTSGVRPWCVASGMLRARVLGGQVRPAAWVSLETEVAELPDGASLGTLVIAQGSPSAPATLEGDVLRWDVGDLIRWHATHQPGAPLVLVLKPAFFAGSGPVEVAAMESGDGASLAVTEQPGCV